MTKYKTGNMNWIKELKTRWKSKTPEFWQKIMSIAITLGTSAVAVITAEKFFDLRGYGVPDILFTISGYIIVACAAVGLSAKITTTDAIDDNKRSRYDKHKHCDGCDEYDA